MRELISLTILAAALFAGTKLAERFYYSVEKAALTKAAEGLPPL